MPSVRNPEKPQLLNEGCLATLNRSDDETYFAVCGVDPLHAIHGCAVGARRQDAGNHARDL